VKLVHLVGFITKKDIIFIMFTY